MAAIDSAKISIDNMSSIESVNVAAYAMAATPMDREHWEQFFGEIGIDQAEELYMQLKYWLKENGREGE